MKTFDYPQLQLQQVTTLPADADCCIEWRETSEHALINQHLNGERRLRQLLPNGVLWSFGKAPKTVSEF
ncbi:MAG: leucyl aminopeptidase family protein, partial [Reinekea sp.]|nr:leucyl aminopeptidase family protein [Reinekea sp.]